MKNLLIFIIFSFILLPFYNLEGQNLQSEAMNIDPFKQQWQEIDSLISEGLYQSALEQTQQVLKESQRRGVEPALVKAFVRSIDLQKRLKEEGDVMVLELWESFLANETLTVPQKAILQSGLANAYHQYLEQNIWKMQGQADQIDEKADSSIANWSISQFIDRIAELYHASLQEKQALLPIPVNRFDEVLINENQTDQLRPSVYDFLLHEALDHYSNARSYLTQPTDQFVIDDKSFFWDADAFAKLDITTKDTSAYKLKTLQLYQNGLMIPAEDSRLEAFVHLDLMRLKFVHSNTSIDQKDTHYLAALQRLAGKYAGQAVEAEVQSQIAKLYRDQGARYQPSYLDEVITPNPNEKWGYQKAIDLAEKVIDQFPGTYGANECKKLVNSLMAVSVNLQLEQVNIPGQPILGSVAYRNARSINLKIYRLSEADFLRFQDTYDSKERLAILNRLAVYRTKKYNLPEVNDYHQHRVEISIAPLEMGSYVVRFEHEGQAIENPGLLRTQVSNIGYFTRYQDGLTQILLVNRKTGMPLDGATALIYQRTYNRRGKDSRTLVDSLRSNENGEINPIYSNENNLEATFRHGEDQLFYRQGIDSYGNDYMEPLVTRTEFFLDRAIYRPGQTIYFKGLVMTRQGEDDPSILPNEKVTVSFYDVNYQLIESKTLLTNEFGTIHGQFTTPKSGLNGRMTIVSSAGNNRKAFRVESYKRPQFEVAIQPFEGKFALGDTIPVVGEAIALAGNGLANAQVSYTVKRSVSYPWRPYFFSRYFPRPTTGPVVMVNGQTNTDNEGQFTFTFPATKGTSESEANPLYTFEVDVVVTDITGETHTAKRWIRLSDVDTKLALTIDEQFDLNAPDSLGIRTTNLNDVAVDAMVDIKVEAMQDSKNLLIDRYWERPDQHLYSESDFRSQFPHYGYRLEGLDNYKPVKNTVWEKEATVNGYAQLAMPWKDWGVGTYRITVSVANDSNTIESTQMVQVYDASNQLLPVELPYLIHQPADKAKPGEQVKLQVIEQAGAAYPIYLEWGRDRGIQSKQWLKFDGTSLATSSYAVKEVDRGGIFYQISYILHNRAFSKAYSVAVPYDNKALDVTLETFREKLEPGANETWSIKIRGHEADVVAAEMVASMYDASLDAFVPNYWNLDLYRNHSWNALTWNSHYFGAGSARMANRKTLHQVNDELRRSFRSFLWQNWGLRYGRDRFARYNSAAYEVYEESDELKTVARAAAPVTESSAIELNAMADAPAPPPPPGAPKDDQAQSGEAPVEVRENLNETVFFMPQLRTDENGAITLTFTMNEALTRWKFMALAHTKDLAIGKIMEEVITQKELMIQPNPPRFLRTGDEITFTAKVSNLTEGELSGTAALVLADPMTNEVVDTKFDLSDGNQSFKVDAKGTTLVTWKLKVPTNLSVVSYKVIAQTDQFSDGEQNTLPILSNRMLVNESIPLSIRGKQKKTFTFKSLQQSTESPTLAHHQFTLEMSTNPAWYAVQALPYLMEYPHPCTEQIFNRYYANRIGSQIVADHPEIKRLFEAWKSNGQLTSNLDNDEALKQILLQETPWVMDAQSEAEQKQRMAQLFDIEKMQTEQIAALRDLKDRQSSDGGFSWFPGGRDSWYITQYLLEGIGHLNQMGITDAPLMDDFQEMTDRAIAFIDEEMGTYYDELQAKLAKDSTLKDNNWLSPLAIHYLYTRSYYLDKHPFSKELKEAVAFFTTQMNKHWLKQSLYGHAMIGMAAYRLQENSLVDRIQRSLKERALKKEELGIHWKYQNSFYWHQLPLETHVALLEFFAETDNDPEWVEEMKIWLLKNKETTRWETTKSTAAAIFALLNYGENWLEPKKALKIDFPLAATANYEEQMTTAIANSEPGTGYFKESWQADDVIAELGTISLKNPNKTIAWGGMYWQYFEDLDNIKSFEETPLQLKKQLYRALHTNSGTVLKGIEEGTPLRPGEQLMVRLELKVDREMEFVHLKDMRASGLEPINVLSQYKWQGGLGYYESTKDEATHFFFDRLPVGTFVFEYPLRVVHKGDFSNGISSIQCMYAPKFSSHSGGMRLKVE